MSEREYRLNRDAKFIMRQAEFLTYPLVVGVALKPFG